MSESSEKESELYKLESERNRRSMEHDRMKSEEIRLALKILGGLAGAVLTVAGILAFKRPYEYPQQRD